MSAPFGPPGYVLDEETGEVLASAQQVDALAAELVAVEEALAQARDEVADLALRREALGNDLRALLGTGGRADGGSAYVVRKPAPRPSQRVSRSGCERFAEELLGLGIGRMAYQPPGIAEVRRESARIIAAGIDLDVIAPEPMAGPDTIEVVAKSAEPRS